MNFELLKDRVYLTLLAFYNYDRIDSYEKLGQKCGISRQTASKKVKQLIDKELVSIDERKYIVVKNELDIDVRLLQKILNSDPNINAIELKEKLFSIKENIINIAEEFNVSRSTVYHYLSQDMVVYGIVSEGMIKYIGSTKNYEERMKQHILKRPFLTPSNFIILKQITENDRFTLERELIHIIQPEWNIMSR